MICKTRSVLKNYIIKLLLRQIRMILWEEWSSFQILKWRILKKIICRSDKRFFKCCFILESLRKRQSLENPGFCCIFNVFSLISNKFGFEPILLYKTTKKSKKSSKKILEELNFHFSKKFNPSLLKIFLPNVQNKKFKFHLINHLQLTDRLNTTTNCTVTLNMCIEKSLIWFSHFVWEILNNINILTQLSFKFRIVYINQMFVCSRYL